MSSIDFNSREKKYLTITLNDDKKTTIMILSPSKKVMNKLVEIKDLIDDESNDISEDEQINILYETCSVVMSRNKGGINIEKDLLEEIFDIDDVQFFLSKYMEFVGSRIKGKN